jgi:hypothetical protein
MNVGISSPGIKTETQLVNTFFCINRLIKFWYISSNVEMNVIFNILDQDQKGHESN